MTIDDLDVPEGFTAPERFTWEHARSAPSQGGVFLVWPAVGDNTLLYVGEASDLSSRLTHLKTGTRDVSSLSLFLADRLDGDRPGSADAKTLQKELSQLRVAWSVTSAAAHRRQELISALDPVCNRWYEEAKKAPMNRSTWLIRHGEGYAVCRDEWRITLPLDRDDSGSPFPPEWLNAAPGDTTVHTVDDTIRAIGEVHGVNQRGREFVVHIEFFELTAPPVLTPGLRSEPTSVAGASTLPDAPSIDLLDPEDVRLLARESEDLWPPGSPWSADDRSYWIFQANPDQWDLVENLPGMPPGTEDEWTASRNRSRMKAGDAVVLWATGEHGGIHGLARLTGAPELRDRPDFRPESVGKEEWRVPLIVTGHVNPPITRDSAREHPDLRDLSVLKTPWAGTNQSATAAQWRAVITLTGKNEVMEIWSTFIHWADRIARTVDPDVDLRAAKIELGSRLKRARAAFLNGEPWTDLLEDAMHLSVNTALAPRTVNRFMKWLATEPEEAADALRQVWADEAAPGDAVETFSEHLLSSHPYDIGTGAALASVLRMAFSASDNPIIQAKTFRDAYLVLGLERTSPDSAKAHYEDGLALCDRFRAEASDRGLPVDDRLDAQNLIWLVMNAHPPKSWTDEERAAFYDFRAGGAAEPRGEIARLAQRFRRSTGYGSEGDPAFEEQLSELAGALSAEALRNPDVIALRRLAGPAYGSPGPQSGFNILLQSDDGVERVAHWLQQLLYGDGELEERISAALEGDGALPGVKEAMATKALAVVHPERWIPNYVTTGPVGKLAVLDKLGAPLDVAESSWSGRMIASNDRIRELLRPHFTDDPRGMQAFSWWLLQADTGSSSVDAISEIEKLAEQMHYPIGFVERTMRAISHKRQIVFYGPPGTGKTFYARRLAEHLSRGGGTTEIVQFHPSYSYEDFVEGYRPVSVEGQLAYEVVDGPLKRLAHRALERQDVTHVLVIDELNRAPVSKVLGELYFLLEYRDTELRLQYSGTPFALPENLVVLATMNTADRSIALVDAALRRRFHFIGLYPDTEPIDGLLRRFLTKNDLDHLSWIADVVDEANNRVVDRHLALGPSHFLDTGLTEGDIELIWELSVMPYLEEQFLDDPAELARFELDSLRGAITDSAPDSDYPAQD